MRELVDRYKNSGLQTRKGNMAYDKGESMLTGEENKTKAPTQSSYGDMLLGTGASAKQTVQSAYSKLFPNAKNKDLFGSIDEKEIERNIPLAESVIEKNKNANPLNRVILEDLPYLRPALATFYTAAFSGNYEAANAARTLAYTEDAGVSLAEVDSKEKKEPESKKRYVNADIGLNVRSEAGTDNPIIGKLKKGTEVEFTGKKTGIIDDHEWAEIKYGDKTGWVAADCLNTEMPYDMEKPSDTEKPKDEKTLTQTAPKSQDNIGARRYIGKNEIFLYESPTMVSSILRQGHFGEEVIFLGEKKINGFEWAKVNYKGKVGWVKAESLRTQLDSNIFDKNAPKDLLVKKQENDVKTRTDHLNKNIPDWIKNDEQKPDKNDIKNIISKWYKNSKKANVRYTGPYCLPVPIDRINQGFYGLHSHAGANYESGHLGAIDFNAPLGTPVYSVLGGKVVYTYKESPKGNEDMHRVTVETKINGEIYYLEYLHMDVVNVEIGQTLYAGTQLGKSGGWGNDASNDFPKHLDFRIYQFKNDDEKEFHIDSKKQFFDPLEFFDFDVQFEYNMAYHDYH